MRRDNRCVFSSPLVSIGRFRCPAGDPLWTSENCIAGGDIIVFPRTATGIHQDGHPPVIGTPNVAMIYNDGQTYRRRLVDDRGDACEWFSLERRALREFVAAFDPAAAERCAGPFPVHFGPVDAEVFLTQRRIYETVRSGQPVDAMAIEEQTLGVFEAVIGSALSAAAPQRTPARSPTRRRHEALACDASELLARHFTEPLGLSDVATALDVTPFHLARVFRRRTGWTLHAYLTHLRLRSGLELLRETRWSIGRIALHVGFASHSHFCDQFRAAFGRAPSAVRQSRRSPAYETDGPDLC